MAVHHIARGTVKITMILCRAAFT